MKKTYEISSDPYQLIDDSDDAYFIVHVESKKKSTEEQISQNFISIEPTKPKLFKKNTNERKTVKNITNEPDNTTNTSNDSLSEIPKPIIPNKLVTSVQKVQTSSKISQQNRKDPYYNWYEEAIHANQRLKEEKSKYERKLTRKITECKRNIMIKRSENDNLIITNSTLLSDKRLSLIHI